MKKIYVVVLIVALALSGCQSPVSTENTQAPVETVTEQVPDTTVETPSETPTTPEVEVSPSVDKTAQKFLESSPSAADIVAMIKSDTLSKDENTKLLSVLVKENEARGLGIMNDFENQTFVYQGFNALYSNTWTRQGVELYDPATKKITDEQYAFFLEMNNRYMRVVSVNGYLSFDNDYENMQKDLEGHLNKEGKDFLKAAYNTFAAIESTKQSIEFPYDANRYIDKIIIVEDFLKEYPMSVFQKQVEGYYGRLVYDYFIYENGESAFNPSDGLMLGKPYNGLIYASETYKDYEFGKFAEHFVKIITDNKFLRPDNLVSILNAHKAFGYASSMNMDIIESKGDVIETYPLFSAIKSDAFTKMINDNIKAQRQEMLDAYGWDASMVNDVKAVLYTNVTMTNDRIISGYTNGSFDKNGERTEYFSTFNYDLENELPMTLLGLMTDDEKGEKLLMEKINGEHKRYGYTVTGYSIDSNTVFYIDDQYLYIVVPNEFSDYPYGRGLTILVPRFEIADILPSDL